jgi:thioredoxin reductase (NADPH)
MPHHKLIILGSGPAGYTAAVYAARANLAPVLITGNEPGGQLIKTNSIDNWSGDVQGVSGFDLMERMKNHAERFETKIISDHITSADLSSRPFKLQSGNDSYTCDTLIVATGASAKYLEIPSEQKYMNKGVSACAVCDGYFFKNAKVAVIGGGNTAVEDALYLAKLAKEVTLIHRRNALRAEEILVKQLLKEAQSGSIKIEWDSVVDEIVGDDNGVKGLRIKNVVNNSLKQLDVTGVFIAIGHKPNSDLFGGQLEMNNGYIKIARSESGNFTATSVPGVFAAGDICDAFYRQAITSAGMGCMAALDAKKFLLG